MMDMDGMMEQCMNMMGSMMDGGMGSMTNASGVTSTGFSGRCSW